MFGGGDQHGICAANAFAHGQHLWWIADGQKVSIDTSGLVEEHLSYVTANALNMSTNLGMLSTPPGGTTRNAAVPAISTTASKSRKMS